MYGEEAETYKFSWPMRVQYQAGIHECVREESDETRNVCWRVRGGKDEDEEEEDSLRIQNWPNIRPRSVSKLPPRFSAADTNTQRFSQCWNLLLRILLRCSFFFLVSHSLSLRHTKFPWFLTSFVHLWMYVQTRIASYFLYYLLLFSFLSHNSTLTGERSRTYIFDTSAFALALKRTTASLPIHAISCRRICINYIRVGGGEMGEWEGKGEGERECGGVCNL